MSCILTFKTDQECRPVVDIAFIIDSSGSIGRTNWERMKRFLKALISKLDVSPSATHVAAVAYSNNANVEMRFNNVQNTNEVIRILDDMRWQRGFTYTDKALLLADSDLFQTANGMRPNIAKVNIFYKCRIHCYILVTYFYSSKVAPYDDCEVD